MRQNVMSQATPKLNAIREKFIMVSWCCGWLAQLGWAFRLAHSRGWKSVLARVGQGTCMQPCPLRFKNKFYLLNVSDGRD